MSTTTTKRGRLKGGEPAPTLTPFGLMVAAALAERARLQSEGPRSRSDLARLLGCSPQQMHGALTGARPRPTEDQIRAVLPELLVSGAPEQHRFGNS